MPRIFWLLGIFASMLFPNAASATMTEVFGGPGGGPFSLACDPGHYLIGFHARAGGSVDGIGLICAPYDARTGKAGAGHRKGYTGGRGGMEQEVYCAPGELVSGFGLAHTRGDDLPRQFVNTVDIFCQHRGERTGCISSGEGCGPIPPKSKGVGSLGSAVYQYDRPNCPSNEYATGIQGRSGIYIDAIGLICAAPPPVTTAGPATPSLGHAPQQVEMNIDRPGKDYRNFDMTTASHEECRAACASDGKCDAYTYVKPGVQGPKARCWLKDGVPPAHANNCCVSGVKPIRALGKKKPGIDDGIDYGGMAPRPPSKGTLIK